MMGFAPDAGAQQFMTREGHVHFFSSTPIEDIEADNRQMSGLMRPRAILPFKSKCAPFTLKRP